MKHYTNIAVRDLFVAALEDDHTYRLAAQLWNADDGLQISEGGRDGLLSICGGAGFGGTADIADLHTYACAMNAALAQSRPTIDSFGPVDTAKAPGDPKRDDASFLDAAFLLLALKESPGWLSAATPGMALDAGKQDGYAASLANYAGLCANPPKVTE
ncbi:hypothetical protein Back2_20290 [Nocardioides baekrokdamisoli]|uniref:Uncharacterized protein n=1 Tax=Nocardioides baekrokdamisoli TaxID=1804624 RepID=A0A3G9IHR0_9ACTN|nr:hypothetical protein [Nocardioides baekrokdamisoli]BBH17742.1 hypothetical protein Back2_20290 [Nocardioides baekrokdamisoli]